MKVVAMNDVRAAIDTALVPFYEMESVDYFCIDEIDSAICHEINKLTATSTQNSHLLNEALTAILDEAGYVCPICKVDGTESQVHAEGCIVGKALGA